MPKIAPIFRSVSSAFALAAILAAGPALSAEPPAPEPDSAAKPAPGAEVKCRDKQVIARGQGFVPSKKNAEEAAKVAWLPKAQAIFADASWDTAQQAAFLCAKQGLYMNCTASAIPCGTKPGAPAETKN
jgi:hypothetical protein